MTIAEQVKEVLASTGDDGRLRMLVDVQTEIGVKKYGQTLDDNKKEPKAKAVHIIQELIDAMQYSQWLLNDATDERAVNTLTYNIKQYAIHCNSLMFLYDLTMEDLLVKEQHNGGNNV